MHPITNIVIVILTSGAVSVILSFYLRSGYEKLEVKRDVLRRFVANRHRLTGAGVADGEPFIALNKATKLPIRDLNDEFIMRPFGPHKIPSN